MDARVEKIKVERVDSGMVAAICTIMVGMAVKEATKEMERVTESLTRTIG